MSQTNKLEAVEKPKARTERVKEIKLASAVLGLDVSADGKRLFAACLDGGVYEAGAENGEVSLIGRHDSYASGVALLPGGAELVSSGYDGVLQWHDLTERTSLLKVAAHQFWSWQMALSKSGGLAASVTGQYLCGGYKYEPEPEREPSVKVFHSQTGEVLHQFSHVPPVHCVAFSPDDRYLAAANLMGEIRVWELADGKQRASWTTPDFTSWGIIKTHCYMGGIYGIAFSPDGNEILVCGMGPMNDPMSGNGKQLWQRFAWRDTPVRKLDETHDGEHGGGLQETLSFHPSGRYFVMAGRLAQGNGMLASSMPPQAVCCIRLTPRIVLRKRSSAPMDSDCSLAWPMVNREKKRIFRIRSAAF